MNTSMLMVGMTTIVAYYLRHIMNDGNAPNGLTNKSASLQSLQLQYATQLTAKIYRAQATLPLFGIGFLIAFFMNNFRYKHVNGTWLQTHFRWQIQTFIFGVIWAAIGIFIVLQSQAYNPKWTPIGLAMITMDIIWIYYRIIKGRRRLKRGQMMYRQKLVEDAFE